MAWYVLYTSAKAEKKVQERLRQMGIETFLPLHKVKRQWSDRVKTVEVPLFSSYIFVNCNEHQVLQLTQVYGISRVVYYLNRPAIVKDQEIEAIKKFLVVAQNKKIINCGDQVEIIKGPFKNQACKVLQIAKTKAKLVIEEIGVNISVSLQEIDKKVDGLQYTKK